MLRLPRIEGLTRGQTANLVKVGANARLAELKQEASLIESIFPDLKKKPATVHTGATQVEEAVPPRRRGKISDAGRKAISRAQKRRWAAIRRKAN